MQRPGEDLWFSGRRRQFELGRQQRKKTEEEDGGRKRSEKKVMNGGGSIYNQESDLKRQVRESRRQKSDKDPMMPRSSG